MHRFSISPKEMLGAALRHRALIAALVRREVVGRYKGSVIGLLWSFVNPVLMLIVYTFVFSVVFKARWTADSESKTEFAMVLFTGLIVFNVFAECVNRAPGLILANVTYVKKVVFPLEILPLVALGSALFHTCASLVVWLVFYLVFFGVPHWTIVLLPLMFLPLLLITLGLSWFLASLGTYVRDVGQAVGIIVSVLMFLSPIFYPISALPDAARQLLALNPLSPAIEHVRGVLVWGVLPDWIGFASYLGLSLVVAWLGFAWFQMTRKGLADVL